MSDNEDVHYDQGDHYDNSYDKAYQALKTDMTLDQKNPWQRSVRGVEEGETLKASRVFRKNNDK